jgi:hypothetical protein
MKRLATIGISTLINHGYLQLPVRLRKETAEGFPRTAG